MSFHVFGACSGLHLAAVVGDAREGDPGPREVPAGRALIGGLERRVLRGDVLLVAALLLEVDGGGDVGELQHVDAEAVGRALRGDLGVEGSGLGAHVAGLDLGEVLAEALQEGRDAGLAVVAVVDDLAFLLRLRDVRAGVEVEHLGVLRGALGGGGTDRAQDGRGGQQRARLQDLTATDAMGLVIGHGGLVLLDGDWAGAVVLPRNCR